MFEINLEEYYPEILADKTIICNIRKRPINQIPEELIRQAFIKYLSQEKGYPIERMQIEVPLSRFSKNIQGRADLLIHDDLGNILCLVEIKRPNEILSDRVLDQVEHYVKYINPQTVCVVIGNQIYFCGYDENGIDVLLSNVPTYDSLISGLENEEVIVFPDEIHSNLELNDDDITFLLNNAIIGESTDEKYHKFLIKLYNLYYNRNSKLTFENNRNIDLGIKYSKFGNASGGIFFGEYRSFLNRATNKIVSFAISSITKGENYPTYTSLMFAVEEKGNFHHSLQLRVDKNIIVNENTAEISHDGSLTIGKLGAAKKEELLNFIIEEKPEIVSNNKIILGILKINEEIDINSLDCKNYIENCIDYAILRDKFREIKKGCR